MVDISDDSIREFCSNVSDISYLVLKNIKLGITKVSQLIDLEILYRCGLDVNLDTDNISKCNSNKFIDILVDDCGKKYVSLTNNGINFSKNNGVFLEYINLFDSNSVSIISKDIRNVSLVDGSSAKLEDKIICNSHVSYSNYKEQNGEGVEYVSKIPCGEVSNIIPHLEKYIDRITAKSTSEMRLKNNDSESSFFKN
jgi:DNA-binding beta-propeller fold protein YncE